MKCHFVYAVPTTGLLKRFRRKAYLKLQHLGLPLCWFGERHKPDTSWWPFCSPYENTKHIFEGLSSRLPTLLYSLDEHVQCRFSPDDIFLGHPFFPYHPGKEGVTELSIEQSHRPRVFALISPLHCNTNVETKHINKPYLESVDRLLDRADILFAIMGQYWWDRWSIGPFAHWIPKMVRLDMAVDTSCFPRVKTHFNPPGKRRYIYIGHNDPMKGTDFLNRLSRDLRGFRCEWIGSGPEILGVPRISEARPLTPDFMRRIAKDFDFFISPSVADPNPTTILESMAWGFPVICTPQSGYYETSYMKNIYLDDLERSIEVLHQSQYKDEQELIKMADEAREVVQREYTWGRFVGTICKELGLE